MDKRIERSKQAIYDSFGDCLKRKGYDALTVEDVLKGCGISRSTFYAHFKDKEDVLISLTDDIFGHVFSHSLEEEKTHDFSKTSIFDYQHFITHILYHLHDKKDLVSAILRSSSREIFFSLLREKLKPLSNKAFEGELLRRKDIPEELQRREAIENFITLISYWFDNDCQETPESMTRYFMEMNR